MLQIKGDWTVMMAKEWDAGSTNEGKKFRGEEERHYLKRISEGGGREGRNLNILFLLDNPFVLMFNSLSLIIMKENVFVLGRYMLKHFSVKCREVCNFQMF